MLSYASKALHSNSLLMFLVQALDDLFLPGQFSLAILFGDVHLLSRCHPYRPRNDFFFPAPLFSFYA